MDNTFSRVTTLASAWLLALHAGVAEAALPIVEYFKEEDGSTNWQYLANWSSGTLIIILSIVLFNLYRSHRSARKANKALEEIKAALELRVQERTATLRASNQLLEGEIIQHRETSRLLRQSEILIKDILESMPLMLIGIDKSMNITQWNKCAEEFTGLNSDQVIGQNLWKVYPTITLSQGQVNEVVKKNQPATFKHCQRGQYYFDITIYPLSAQGETGVVVLIDNVTQRIIAENMLVQRDKMSSMGELAATMSTDINIPLQGILRDIELIREKIGAEDDLAGLLSDAAERGRQATGVIGNLLDFSRSQSDSMRLASITDVVDHSLELAVNVLSDPSGLRFRDIAIERKYEKNLTEVPCYVPELQQVFFSLFRHACHALAAAAGRAGFVPKITVEILECYEQLWIKVQHNGQGLTYDEQQYIFEPFFNKREVDESVDAARRLSFSYYVVNEHHNGQMAVTSDVNVGTTFHIQLQLKVPGFNKPIQHA